MVPTLTLSPTDLEQSVSDAPLGKKEIARLDLPCRIHIHSQRKRLADADGICGKYAIDGLIHAGILPNDSPEWVREVGFSQEKTKGEEKTIITIEEVVK